jgi:hypothetical protein
MSKSISALSKNRALADVFELLAVCPQYQNCWYTADGWVKLIRHEFTLPSVVECQIDGKKFHNALSKDERYRNAPGSAPGRMYSGVFKHQYRRKGKPTVFCYYSGMLPIYDVGDKVYNHAVNDPQLIGGKCCDQNERFEAVHGELIANFTPAHSEEATEVGGIANGASTLLGTRASTHGMDDMQQLTPATRMRTPATSIIDSAQEQYESPFAAEANVLVQAPKKCKSFSLRSLAISLWYFTDVSSFDCN